MNRVYSVVYYNIDDVKNSEVIGVYSQYEKAVEYLIKAAHFDCKDGKLRQYKRNTNEYDSFETLYNMVFEKQELIDFDIYKIETVQFL